MPKPPPDLVTRKSLRQALRFWDNSQKLGALPLAGLGVVEARRRSAGYGDTPTGLGVALRDVLHDALDRLKPEGQPDPNDRRWRPYLILRGQYLEGRAPEYLIEQLSIARSTYDHEQAGSLDSLAGILRELEHAQPRDYSAIPPSASPPFLAPPRPPYPLVGRDSLLRDLKSLLFARSPAALNGLPGVGKTALAIQLAHDPEILSHFADGVLWASLGRLPDVLAALGVWGVALGLPLDEIGRLSRVEDRARVIQAAIGLRRMLLVIDDVWRIDDALSFKIGGANCAYLLTTRILKTALDFAGDAATPVRELDEADGLSLLAQYGVAVADSEARSLVTAVGGLPLALTLIGRYLQRESRLGQPRRLRAALDRLTQIGACVSLTQARSPLESRPDAAPLSLLTVIAGTDDALDDEARMALRSLSVFPPKPNTFDEAAALEVSGASGAALDALVDYGLLEIVSSGRYTLHPAIHEYAARQSRDPSPRMRFVSYFTAFATRHAGNDPALESEIANILTALNAAFDLDLQADLIHGVNAVYPFLETRGLQTLAETHLWRAETIARRIDDRAALCATLNHMARLDQRRGDYSRAEASYNEALSLARELNDAEPIGAALSGLGVLAFNQGRYEQAESFYREGLALARKHDLRDRLSGLLANMGALAFNRGYAPQAESFFQEGLVLARSLGNRPLVSALLINLGVSAAQRGDYDRAGMFFQESLELARSAGHREAVLFLLTNLGALASDLKDRVGAEGYFREALALARKMDERARISHLLANLGALAAASDDFAGAEACYDEGLAVARAIGHRENMALLLLNQGEMERKRGRADAAKACYEEALALAQALGHPRYERLIRDGMEKL